MRRISASAAVPPAHTPEAPVAPAPEQPSASPVPPVTDDPAWTSEAAFGGAGPYPAAPFPQAEQEQAPAPQPEPEPAPAPQPQARPDDSPTMVLPVIGAIKTMSAGRLILSAIGVIALIVAGVLALIFLIPADDKKSGAKDTQPKAAAVTESSVISPSATASASATPAVQRVTLAEICGKSDPAPFRALYPGIAAGVQTPPLGCAWALEYKAPVATPPVAQGTAKPVSLNRAGQLSSTLQYFPSSIEAYAMYGAKPLPGAAGLPNLGDQATIAVAPAGKQASLQLSVVRGNVMLNFNLGVSREDKDWAQAELDQLKAALLETATATLSKLQ